tara:strand:+ start:140 stop:370 length:231 start_codon:yes stop_codon:yes gene_type:complete
MKLSNQAMGAIMMALQKSLLEQSDIVPTLQSFEFMCDEQDCLTVTNPPKFKIDKETYEADASQVFDTETTSTTGSD